MSKYLITLAPTGKFFFGGDMTFQVGNNEKSEHNKQYSSYIIKSGHFPQQTSLLGMLRFLILSNSPAFDKIKQEIQDKAVAKTLIGSNSFKVNNDTCNSFGKINSLSPCILQMSEDGENWSSYLPPIADYGLTIDFSQSLSNVTVNSALKESKKKQVPSVKGYNPKERQQQQYIPTSGIAEIEQSDIFTEDQRIGINKDYSGKTKDASFYKQISYRFGKKENCRVYRFAFMADIDLDLSGMKKIVSIGGDSSQFVLEVLAEDIVLQYPQQNNYDCFSKVILLSDSYISEAEVDNSIFAISDTKPFRFLQTSVYTKSYNILSQSVVRSKRINLYKAGSVFYFENTEAHENFVTALKNKEDFRQIGYNYFNEFIKNQK